MANEEQLAILKQGVDAWNWWRAGNSKLEVDLIEAALRGAALRGADLGHVDLRGADLSQADLRGADLSWTDLTKTHLIKADLREAHFIEADLRGADLSQATLIEAHLQLADFSEATLIEADLRWTDLRGAYLTEVDLRWADLRGAYLTEANLSRANLSRANLGEIDLQLADLSEAKMGGTVIGEVDLSEVKGLETIRHEGPSYISIGTIYRSQGKIPEVFLRSAGVPENFITYMHSLTGKAFEFYSCFISHSSKDTAFAERLYADLQSKGVRCWYAPEDLEIGEPFVLGIDRGIRLHDKLLLVLSEHSVQSGWVQHEILSALAKEQGKEPWVLFPIRLDDAVMQSNVPWTNMVRQSRHIGDFTRWEDYKSYQKAFARLLRDLKAGGSGGLIT